MQNHVNTQRNTISAQEFCGKIARARNKGPKHAQKLNFGDGRSKKAHQPKGLLSQTCMKFVTHVYGTLLIVGFCSQGAE